jgi:hypothetical protein
MRGLVKPHGCCFCKQKAINKNATRPGPTGTNGTIMFDLIGRLFNKIRLCCLHRPIRRSDLPARTSPLCMHGQIIGIFLHIAAATTAFLYLNTGKFYGFLLKPGISDLLLSSCIHSNPF